MGTQCWVYCAIMFCEGILCIKNGKALFSQTHGSKVVSWLLIQAALSILFVSGCIFWHRYVQVGNCENSIISVVYQESYVKSRDVINPFKLLDQIMTSENVKEPLNNNLISLQKPNEEKPTESPKKEKSS